MPFKNLIDSVAGRLFRKNRSLSAEIATRDRVDFISLMKWLPNPDPVLKKLGRDVDAYEEIRSDGYIRGCINSRKAGVTSLQHGIDRGKAKSRQAREIEALFNDLDIHGLMGEILDAPQFGYSPIEVVWGNVGNYWLPRKISGKPARWFLFGAKNELRLRTLANSLEGEEVPDYKFLLPRQEATYDNPYGFPNLSCCFWPAVFKKGGMKSWAIFAEKWGSAFAIGKLPRGASDADKRKLLSELESMVEDACGVIPDDSSVEIVESAGKTASGGLYSSLIQTCKAEISVVQLGHEGGALATPGRLGGEDGAQAVRSDIVDADRKIVEQTFNTLIGWIWNFNFTGARPVWSMWKEEDVDDALAGRDTKLVQVGVRFTPDYISENYGIPKEQFTMAEPYGPRGGQFSEGGNSNTQTIVDHLAARLESEAPVDDLMKPVLKLVAAAKSLQEIQDGIIELYPDQNVSTLAEIMGEAMAAAELAGRATAFDGPKE